MGSATEQLTRPESDLSAWVDVVVNEVTASSRGSFDRTKAVNLARRTAHTAVRRVLESQAAEVPPPQGLLAVSDIAKILGVSVERSADSWHRLRRNPVRSTPLERREVCNYGPDVPDELIATFEARVAMETGDAVPPHLLIPLGGKALRLSWEQPDIDIDSVWDEIRQSGGLERPNAAFSSGDILAIGSVVPLAHDLAGEYRAFLGTQQ